MTAVRRDLANGRTLMPKFNDSLSGWLHRLVFGRRWAAEPQVFECLYGGHRFVFERPVAVNDAEATNLATLSFFAAERPCSSCAREGLPASSLVPALPGRRDGGGEEPG